MEGGSEDEDECVDDQDPRRESGVTGVVDDEDENMTDADQENESHRSPYKSSPPPLPTPRRPHGAAVPLGELIMEDDSDSNSEEMEPEYPPSPRKSPSKSPAK